MIGINIRGIISMYVRSVTSYVSALHKDTV